MYEFCISNQYFLLSFFLLWSPLFLLANVCLRLLYGDGGWVLFFPRLIVGGVIKPWPSRDVGLLFVFLDASSIVDVRKQNPPTGKVKI